jgi:hypothetical protein
MFRNSGPFPATVQINHQHCCFRESKLKIPCAGASRAEHAPQARHIHTEPVPIGIWSATIQDRAWTDARRRDILRTVFGGFYTAHITVPLRTETRLYSAERIQAGETVDSKNRR